MRKKITIILITVFAFNSLLRSQEVYQHISSSSIYEFIDELANEQVIEVNTLIKPYSRKFIANKLYEASQKKELLNKRQKDQLEFFLRDYNKELKPNKDFKKRIDLFFYKDSLFSLSVNPILGINYFMNDSGSVYKRWNGAEAFAYIGDHWGFYASLRDNYESEAMAAPTFLNQRTGATFKASEKNEDRKDIEYSEMRGGITYNWNWGTVGLVKDHFTWGDNYNGANIFSGKTPSFAHLKLKIQPTKWFDFNYIHGWLVSEVTDSSRSYFDDDSTFRTVLHNKYVAANMFTFRPLKGLSISIGNSIIYSDMNVHPAYLNPVMFYKSVDHTYNSTDNSTGQNAQMFGNISYRGIKHLHLYSSLYFDELHITNMWDAEKHTNWYSAKGGMHISNLVPNTFLTFEYTRTNPMVYKHFISTTTFESNLYNLGHYLKDNSEELYLSVAAKPIKNLSLKASYTKAQKGNNYIYGKIDPAGIPFMDSVTWEASIIDLKAAYEVINDGHVFLQAQISDFDGDMATYTPQFMHGKQNTIMLGINYGF